MPRIDFNTSIVTSGLTLTETQELVTILGHVQDALANNGYPVEDQPNITAATGHEFGCHFSVTFGGK